MATDKLFFSTVKEDRGWYFVEYQPPHPGYRFSMLSLVFPTSAAPSAVAEAMESELTTWLRRYPMPLMVSAFDAKGDLCELEGVRASNHLMGSVTPGTDRPVMFWRLLPDSEIPGDMPSPESLIGVFADVPYKTSNQTRQEAEAHARQMRIGWAIVFVWVAVVPAVWAIFEWAGPAWVGVLLLGYSLWQALANALKLLGKWRESPKELKAREELRRMQHHHYHCERNPEGFMRLKLENFEREERERIQNEAKALKPSE
jgi:hypothetical protein